MGEPGLTTRFKIELVMDEQVSPLDVASGHQPHIEAFDHIKRRVRFFRPLGFGALQNGIRAGIKSELGVGLCLLEAFVCEAFVLTVRYGRMGSTLKCCRFGSFFIPTLNCWLEAQV
ncbi:hypothetical protein FRX31_003120 [Thalictrum thalictroides]|uniref:Uncharacterized protein n=1 Tax=Thalictrum thalictroides TaxID=46969 RepID=A0A7J6XCS9_THATH|nr:hypothetical protein FRX31_003120 [Thalictrum thalictroides]